MLKLEEEKFRVYLISFFSSLLSSASSSTLIINSLNVYIKISSFPPPLGSVA